MEPTTDTAVPVASAPESAENASGPHRAELLVEEILVEEISIDGMCGVY